MSTHRELLASTLDELREAHMWARHNRAYVAQALVSLEVAIERGDADSVRDALQTLRVAIVDAETLDSIEDIIGDAGAAARKLDGDDGSGLRAVE